MKRLTLSLSTLCFLAFLPCDYATLRAESVGEQAALYTAQTFMLAKGKTIETSPVTSQGGSHRRKAASTEEETPYYYVFNVGGDGGYVIVSGDDRTEPILGYVDQGTFDPDNIPENMSSWLQFYADQIKYIKDNDIQPDSPILKKRNKVSGTKHSIPELLTTRWNQGNPYNITCPKYYKGDGSQHYPAAGCVATAMAQVVYYYKFPEKTKAVIPAHSNTYKLDDGTEKTVTVKAVPRGTTIDWENMRDTYSWNGFDNANAQDTAVANLMLYCGQSVKMGWGASSGATTSRARDVFVNYFGYNSSAYWGGRGSYSIDEWFEMLYDEMEAGYPVLYCGHSSGGGHAFVIDGFDGDNLFHVNWGWGGGSNGWFLIGILNPGDNSGMGASSSSDGYSMSQGALFNLRTTAPPKQDTHLYIGDVSLANQTIKATFTNKTGSTGAFNTGIVMLDEDGSLALVGNKQTISSMENGATQSKTFSLRKKLPEGTYRLSPASKSSRGEIWHPKYNMQSQYIEAVVDADSTVTLTPINISVGNQVSISIDTITFPGTRIMKKEQEVKVKFRNDGAEYFKTVYFFASQTNKKVYTESKSMVAIRTGETAEVSYFFTPDTTGIYNLWFCNDDKGNGVIGQGTMEVIDEASAVKANLAVSSYTINNLVEGIAYGKRLIGRATIKNNAKEDYHGSVKFQLWNQKVGNNTAYSGPTRTYHIDVVAGKTASVEFEFDGLSEGYYYRFKVSYGNQDGTLSNGGLWDNRWEMKAGLLTWKTDGTVAGQAYRTTFTAPTTACGVYADCGKITRLRPNANPNTIYAFAPDMEIPTSLDSSNVVSGNHAKRINLVNDKPYYIPTTFDADSASFTYTFPETEDGTKWHALTMPFESDSICVDSIPVSLSDTLKHFWIYEFTAEDSKGNIVFKPVTKLRGGTPYIIAADSYMAGRSIVFHATDVSFFKTGTDKMLVSSPGYKFHGNTHAPRLKDCYLMNEEGTAFDYTATNKLLTGLNSYFTTALSEELRLPSIVLPEIPTVQVILGDINGDTKVDIADAVSVLNIMAGGEFSQIADINGDGQIDIADFVSILNIMAGGTE